MGDISASRKMKGRNIISFPREYIVIDLETTGCSPLYDEIIEFAGIKISNGAVSKTFSTLVKPVHTIDDFITQITGITNEMVADAPTIGNALPMIREFIGEHILIGHNINFDINFLYDACVEYDELALSNDYVDTLRIARKLYPELHHHRLQDLIDLFELKPDARHRAVADCIVCNECFNRMRADVIAKYNTEEDFAGTFKRTHYKLDAKSIVPESTEFDTSHPLYGKVCVFTGTLDKMARKDAMQLVVNIGGICGNNVTAKTDFLILGNNDYCALIKDGKSRKQKKVESLQANGSDIKIITEDVFYDLVLS